MGTDRILVERVAELEAEKARLSNTVELVKHGLNGPWDPGGDVAALAKEAGDTLQLIGRLSSVGDWSMYCELPPKVVAIQARAEAAEAKCRELQDKVTNRDAQLVTQAGAHMLAMTGVRCDLSSERAKSARLGRKLQRLGLHMCETRRKLRKVEGKNREKQGRVEVLEKACRRQVENIDRWLETGEPAGREESKLIYEQLKAALAATEVTP